ncbi:hypothetical protein EPA93_09250 [Ktedonosporobacter rubrisoli]|uniref:Uncharacterized protein n=1 Tax=Ktedonosporobacter rubrisoli TaxID=2509675 RepID=A0A4P6JLU0_KTERU|nr:hypothetical protein [Ktedonosporobacter rubrisoli]QBD76185.1 hypothetical protein EPA93_09250 [Ktedonosporobacter rubrisoli]
MVTLSNALSIINMLLMIFGIVGGLFALRHGSLKAANEVQERAINALQAELATVRLRLTDLQAENGRLKHIVATIVAALNNCGIELSINGDMVNIKSDQNGKSTTAHIQEALRPRSGKLLAAPAQFT